MCLIPARDYDSVLSEGFQCVKIAFQLAIQVTNVFVERKLKWECWMILDKSKPIVYLSPLKTVFFEPHDEAGINVLKYREWIGTIRVPVLMYAHVLP